MQFKSSLLGAAIVLAFSVGSAHAADQFVALDGVTVQPMSAMELDSVRGTKIGLIAVDVSGSNIFVSNVDITGNAPPPIIFVSTAGTTFLLNNQ